MTGIGRELSVITASKSTSAIGKRIRQQPTQKSRPASGVMKVSYLRWSRRSPTCRDFQLAATHKCAHLQDVIPMGFKY
jgi:hypothetical protein